MHVVHGSQIGPKESRLWPNENWSKACLCNHSLLNLTRVYIVGCQNTFLFFRIMILNMVLQVSPWGDGLGAHLPTIWLREFSGGLPLCQWSHSRLLPIQTGREQVSLGLEGHSHGVQGLPKLWEWWPISSNPEGCAGNPSCRNILGSWAYIWFCDMW